MRDERLTVIREGLAFGEGPRWRDGWLYYSDFYRHVVERLNVSGEVEEVARVPTQPSGLGWLPDGRLLIVSMTDRKLLCMEADGTLREHADVSHIAGFNCNDMVVDSSGRAYVGNFGSDRALEGPQTATLAIVEADGTAAAGPDELAFPNGTVITPDGGTLIIGETMGKRLTAFDVRADGTLANRRLWADIDPHFPDGICLDVQGAIWVADPVGKGVVRVVEGGEIVDRIDTGRPAYACMLGGEDGKRLFVVTGETSGDEAARTRNGAIEWLDVEVPRDGLP
ncbi:MAG: SMP-30/gluconolactonase/LRE family protein [Pseudomonadota bacterium]